MEKILITGTGRCGTTFLMKLFSFLGFDTGYDRNNYKESIHSNCNSGMERQYKDNYYILKNPAFILDIEDILKDVPIKTIIIPLRDLQTSAISRINHGNNYGGIWHAFDESSQINFYKDILLNYIFIATKYNVNTIFLDFDKMTNNKRYLFDKLKPILDEKNIVVETFDRIYDEVSLTSKL